MPIMAQPSLANVFCYPPALTSPVHHAPCSGAPDWLGNRCPIEKVPTGQFQCWAVPPAHPAYKWLLLYLVEPWPGHRGQGVGSSPPRHKEAPVGEAEQLSQPQPIGGRT